MDYNLSSAKSPAIRNEEKERFLKDDFSDISEELSPQGEYISEAGIRLSFKRLQRRYWMMWIQAVLFLGNIVIFLSMWMYLETKYAHGPNLVFTPARSSLHFEAARYHVVPGGFTPEYFGPPSVDLEDRWHKLLAPANSWFTKEEVQKFGGVGGNPVMLPNGTHLGSTAVYHHLHCIKRLYQSYYPDHFYHNLTDEESNILLIHNMHCLDFLRKAVMCQGDPSPLVYKWHATQPVPIGEMHYEHECVNWDALSEWAHSRLVDVYQPGLVVHPTLGPAFAHSDEHNQIGAVKGLPLPANPRE